MFGFGLVSNKYRHEAATDNSSEERNTNYDLGIVHRVGRTLGKHAQNGILTTLLSVFHSLSHRLRYLCFGVVDLSCSSDVMLRHRP